MKLELKIIGLNATTAVKRYCSPTGELSLTYLDTEIMKLWLEEQCSILQTTEKEKLNSKIVIDNGIYTLKTEVPIIKNGDIIILQGITKTTTSLPLLSVIKPSSWCYAITTALDLNDIAPLPILHIDHDTYITGSISQGKIIFGSEITLDTLEAILNQLHSLTPPFSPETAGEIALAMANIKHAIATNRPVPRWKYRSYEESTEEIIKIIEMLRLLEEDKPESLEHIEKTVMKRINRTTLQ